MCTCAITQFGIPRVVIGDVTNASSDETIRFLRSRGIEVIVLDPESSKAARDCIDLAARFRRSGWKTACAAQAVRGLPRGRSRRRKDAD